VLTVSGIDIDAVVSCIASSAHPGPLIAVGPVLHHLPDIACGGALQPEAVAYRVLIGIRGLCSPFYNSSSALRALLVGCQGAQHWGLVGGEQIGGAHGAVVACGWVVLSIPGVDINRVGPVIVS